MSEQLAQSYQICMEEGREFDIDELLRDCLRHQKENTLQEFVTKCLSEKGVDAAYDILTPWGSQKLVLPCRTSNICRLLCNCYYFTGDAECGELAGKLVTEALGYMRGNHRDDFLGWWDAICLYDNVVGLMELPIEEQERLKEERVRLAVRVRQVEDDMIEQFVRMGEVSSVDVGLVFYILAKREFVACNTKYEKKE